MTNKTIEFKGTLRLAIETYSDTGCSLERKIKDWVTALKNRDCNMDTHLHIYAIKRNKWFGISREYVCNASLDEIKINRDEPLESSQILQRIFREKFYSRD